MLVVFVTRDLKQKKRQNFPETRKHKNTHTLPQKKLMRYDTFWAFKWMALAKKSELILSHLLLPQHNINITFPPLLFANGCQLGSSELVISHCPLCLVKLSTKLMLLRLNPFLPSRWLSRWPRSMTWPWPSKRKGRVWPGRPGRWIWRLQPRNSPSGRGI